MMMTTTIMMKKIMMISILFISSIFPQIPTRTLFGQSAQMPTSRTYELGVDPNQRKALATCRGLQTKTNSPPLSPIVPNAADLTS